MEGQKHGHKDWKVQLEDETRRVFKKRIQMLGKESKDWCQQVCRGYGAWSPCYRASGSRPGNCEAHTILMEKKSAPQILSGAKQQNPLCCTLNRSESYTSRMQKASNPWLTALLRWILQIMQVLLRTSHQDVPSCRENHQV